MDDDRLKDEGLGMLADSPEGVAQLLRSAAHPMRIKVLAILATGDKDLASLVGSTGLSKNALVNHLSLMIAAGLVRRAHRGNYELTRDGRGLLEAAASIFLASERRKEVERARLRALYDASFYRGARMERKMVSKVAEYQPCWISYNGAMAGCLRALGVERDVVDVGGYSGYAFLVNMSKGATSPGGPTAFADWKPIMEGTELLGFRLRHWFDERSYPQRPGMPAPKEVERARQLFELVKASVERDRPVVVWGLYAPEYGIVNGCDGSSYIVSTFRRLIGQREDPVLYYDLQATGCMDAYFFEDRRPVDLKSKVDEVLRRALRYAKGEFQTVDGFVAGPPALSEWADLLASGRDDMAQYFGNAYCAQCYAESKEIETEFTSRLAKLCSGKRAEELGLCSKEFAKGSKLMDGLAKLFPFGVEGQLTDEGRQKGAELLRDARRFEDSAIAHLERALRA